MISLLSGLVLARDVQLMESPVYLRFHCVSETSGEPPVMFLTDESSTRVDGFAFASKRDDMANGLGLPEDDAPASDTFRNDALSPPIEINTKPSMDGRRVLSRKPRPKLYAQLPRECSLVIVNEKIRRQ